MKTLSIQETIRQFPSLLMEIEQTREPVMICRNGKPIAELMPLPHRSRLQTHPIMSRLAIRYDPIEPLEADEWSKSERRSQNV